MNHNHFEALLLLRVQLLTTGHLLDQFLHDYAVVDLSVAGGYLDMVDGREHVG